MPLSESDIQERFVERVSELFDVKGDRIKQYLCLNDDDGELIIDVGLITKKEKKIPQLKQIVITFSLSYFFFLTKTVVAVNVSHIYINTSPENNTFVF